MMRILLDECGFGWDKAFDICQKVFSYTNHTVMAEALEKWNVDIFKMTLPRIYQIVVEMDRRAREKLESSLPRRPGQDQLYGPHRRQSGAHGQHLRLHRQQHQRRLQAAQRDHQGERLPRLLPVQAAGLQERDQRHRLPPLAAGLQPRACASCWTRPSATGYKHDASDLSKLNKFAEDKTVLKRLNEIKLDNKKNFAAYLEKSTGQVIDPNSIFDCQVKRMHEYKRQHLNALNIAAQYLYLKENPNADFIPKTYIFGAKAAPGYYMAKQMIRMICKLGDLINNDPAVREKLRVVYLEEYCVSLSEHLMPAAEVSEQISLAGTEASGTGNMKFMLNGAITLGTLDGANVEIADAAGKENELDLRYADPRGQQPQAGGLPPQRLHHGRRRCKRRSELPGARLERRELPRSHREPAQPATPIWSWPTSRTTAVLRPTCSACTLTVSIGLR